MNSDAVPQLAVTIPLAGVLGLFIGSFLNVVVYRVPLGLSVSTPRSFCPTCDRKLAWWENVPVVSWIALRGRCHTCHQPISARYPLVELSTAVAFGLIAWAWSGSPGVAAGYCVLAAGTLAVGLIEYGGTRAPLVVAAVATALGQALIVVGAGWQGHWRIVVGSLIGSAVALVVFSLLRVGDPECTDARGHGRSILLLAGCWVGALSGGSIALAAGVWIAAYFVCMVGAWSVVRQPAVAGSTSIPSRTVPSVLATPLVSALAVAMAASLVAAA